jgi:hypothetical protein
MKVLIMQFSATSYHFIPLRSNCSQHLVLKWVNKIEANNALYVR